jgi:hypothetical protein
MTIAAALGVTTWGALFCTPPQNGTSSFCDESDQLHKQIVRAAGRSAAPNQLSAPQSREVSAASTQIACCAQTAQ